MRLTFTALLALLFCSLCVKCYIPGLPSSRGERSDKAERSTAHPLSEMLVPRGSTTALMCEPVFSGNAQSAYWLQNGRVVANVTSTTNAILHDRFYASDQQMPKVGFLIITNISNADEGDYWCQLSETGEEGERVRIAVAFVDQFPSDLRPRFIPSSPLIGQAVLAHCPYTNASPKPTISWSLNGEPLDLLFNRIEILQNGSLFIKRFQASDAGLYECTVSNFAGRTTSKIFVETKFANDISAPSIASSVFSSACSSVLRSAVLWFLVGCLSTSCVVLLYLLCAIILIRPSGRNRLTIRPSIFMRSQPSLGPGFRKAIVPVPDLYTGQTHVDTPINQ